MPIRPVWLHGTQEMIDDTVAGGFIELEQQLYYAGTGVGTIITKGMNATYLHSR